MPLFTNMQVLSHFCGREAGNDLNMNLVAFRYLLPAPWRIGIRTWEKILAQISH